MKQHAISDYGLNAQKLVKHMDMAEKIITWLCNEKPLAVVARVVEKLNEE